MGTLWEAAREAARRYGTPLYLYDLPRLRADAEAVAQAFPDPWIRLYSLKANGLPGLLRELPALGFGASAVSGGELSLAGACRLRSRADGAGGDRQDAGRSARGRPTGSGRDAAAVGEPGVGGRGGGACRAGGSAGARVDVLIRVNPEVQPETHRGLAVGAAGSKFGVLPEELAEVVEAGGGPDGPLRWRGIHLHVGSQLGAVDAWRSAFRLGLRLLALQRAALPDFDTLDAGSGFPVDYGEEGTVPAPARFAEEAAAELAELPADARPARLAIEPGRAIVARSGWLLGRVLHVRDREQRLIVLDAGMTELIRPALYGAEHPIVALTSMGRPVDPIVAGSGIDAGRVAADGPRRRPDLRVHRPARNRAPAAPGARRPGGDRRRRRLRLVHGVDLQRPAAPAGNRLGRRRGCACSGREARPARRRRRRGTAAARRRRRAGPRAATRQPAASL